MALETRLRSRGSITADLVLPPPFRLITLREVGDAFVHAQKVAIEEGAGTLVFVGRFDFAEFAVVLEPNEPLRTARRVFYAAMNALASALIALAPPETEVTIDWPDALRVNGGLVGGGRLAWPKGTGESATPPWLVFGGVIRLVSMTQDPGLFPLETALAEEGFEELGARTLVEGFARHLMATINSLQQDGFAATARDYLLHLAPEKGAQRRLDEAGDLLVERTAGKKTNRRSLVSALAATAWYDPKSGGLRR